MMTKQLDPDDEGWERADLAAPHAAARRSFEAVRATVRAGELAGDRDSRGRLTVAAAQRRCAFVEKLIQG